MRIFMFAVDKQILISLSVTPSTSPPPGKRGLSSAHSITSSANRMTPRPAKPTSAGANCAGGQAAPGLKNIVLTTYAIAHGETGLRLALSHCRQPERSGDQFRHRR